MPADAFEYDVKPNPVALRNLHPVDLPNRAACFPQIWKYDGFHPQLSDDCQAIIYACYVYFIDSTVEGKQKARTLADRLKIPYGRLEVMHEKEPGECRGLGRPSGY